jgi:glutaminyl-peptide cyclotransferase
VVELVPRVVRTLPHDTDAFTQGLELDGDTFVESVGLYGESGIRRLDAGTGEVVAETELTGDLFAEGLTKVGDRWIQLTWVEHVALVWDDDLREVARLDIPEQGWGLCFDGEVLHHSDGSAVLRQRDPEGMREVGRVTVTLDGAPQAQLNELECVDGTVWANVWHTNTILGIDATSGEVTHVVDASALAEQVEVGNPSEDVLNGIAFDDATGHYWLTGKHWPTLFEVELVPAD